MLFREIRPEDIPALFAVRAATDENQLSYAELAEMGITAETVKEKLEGPFKGWLSETGSEVVGFAMGDRSSGELWVIAVLPQFSGQGIGHELLARVENGLAESGCRRLWLTTDIDPRLKAYSFYQSHGWRDERIENGMRYMVKILA